MLKIRYQNSTYILSCTYLFSIPKNRFDEMGRYDSPAFIDYILAVTKREKLIYIGHSQGESSFPKEIKFEIMLEKNR